MLVDFTLNLGSLIPLALSAVGFIVWLSRLGSAHAGTVEKLADLRNHVASEIKDLREGHGKLDHKQRNMEQTLTAVVTRLDVMQEMLREVRDAVKGRP